MFRAASLLRASAAQAARDAAAKKELFAALPQRAVNLSAGCAPLPLEVLKRVQKEFVNTNQSGMSVTEMGYRTKNFHDIMDRAEDKFRQLMRVPDTHEVHFFNGGATLQFAAIPLNLLAQDARGKQTPCNYVMTGHWSEKARNEAQLFASRVNETWVDQRGLYFSVPRPSEWNVVQDAKYMHYTAADTRQGFEWQSFPYTAVPEGQVLCCDASVNLGSKTVDVSKYGVLYAAAHKNFSTAGVCYTIIRKDLLQDKQLEGTPTMCNWWRFQSAPNKIWNVPVIFSVYMGAITCEWMLERGGLAFFEDLAIRRSNVLYDCIGNSGGYYRTFVTDPQFMSRMNIVFTIGSGEGADNTLVDRFLAEAERDLGWLDIKSHPLGLASDAIRVTTYNPQPIEVVEHVRDYMTEFMKRHPRKA